MLRAFAGLVVMCGVAYAKPTVAVLGLEPDSDIARAITDGARNAARGDNSPYELAPSSNVTLGEAKAQHHCDSEADACMAEIGRDLGVDVVVYGRVVIVGEKHEVKLRLLLVGPKRTTALVADMQDSTDWGAVGAKDYRLLTRPR